ncbi:MAG TPA: oligosaccharide flippase family protein [Patescibacteria group bacterium]|nr:oligosaccharide flippase family protein [Patescibacteria group bacterium]
MTTVARNIAANAAGAGLSFLVFLLAVPLYLRLLGAEAYGLVGLFTTVMVAAAALDLGLGATLNREVARLTAHEAQRTDVADVTATLQAACWLVGVVMGGLFALGAPAIATRWLNFSTLSAGEIRGALALMGVALPAIIVRGVYLAGLNGLQRQALANLLQTGGTTLRALVSVAALLLVAPTVRVFFVVQTTLLLAEAIVLGIALRRALPATARGGRVHWATLRPLQRFSGGMAGTLLLGHALNSLDQVILSAILPLAEFGYYTLAVGVAATLGLVVNPVTTAVYPRFSQLVERAPDDVTREYHFFSQLVAVLVLPLGAVLIFFPADVLALWTRNPEVVSHAAAVLSLRAIGTVLNALMHVPHIVQLAFGWSSLGAWANAIALLIMVPATIALSLAWGGVGAALAWIGLNLGMLSFAMARMHRRVLRGELARWYARLLPPALAVALVAEAARAAMPDGLAAPVRLAWLVAAAALAVVAALAAAPTVRRRMVAAVRPA